MKFMQTIMSCKKKTISDKSENLKAAAAQDLSENLHRKIFTFLMYLSAITLNFV